MVLNTIIITRHGFRANWEDPSKLSSPTNIIGDVELSSHGLDQAQELAEYLSSAEPDIQRIYSSPFYRCLQTATPLSTKLGLPILVETGIGEWFKPERSSRPIPAPATKLVEWFPSVDSSYESLLAVDPNGETIEDIHVRCRKFIDVLVRHLDTSEPSISKIVLVTHAAAKLALGRALLDDPDYPIRSGVCSVDKFVRHNSGSDLSWSIVQNGKTDFLTHGEEMHWAFDSAFMPGSTEEAQSRLHPSNTKTDNNDSDNDNDNDLVVSVS